MNCQTTTPLKNERGFSLMSVLIAAALTGVILTSIMTMVKMANDNQKNVDQKMSAQNITNMVAMVLTKPENCLKTLNSNAPLPPISFDYKTSKTVLPIHQISRDDGVVIYSALTDKKNPNQSYENRNLQIETIDIREYTPLTSPSSAADSKFYSGTAYLTLALRKLVSTPGAQSFIRKIPIRVNLVQGGPLDKTIQACSTNINAYLGNGNEYWQPLPTNDGIYYTDKVGIGTSNPDSLFHVQGKRASYASTYFGKLGDLIYSKISDESGGTFEVRSQGAGQAPYFAFKDNNNRDDFVLMPTTSGNGATSFYSSRTFLFSVDPYKWGHNITHPENNTFFDFESTKSPGLTANSGSQSFFRMNPTVTQTGSASYASLLINTKEYSKGSGSHKSIQLKTNDNEIFSVSSTGEVSSAGCLKAGGAVFGTCASDERLKKNIAEFDLGLDIVLKLQPKSYEMNGKGGYPDDHLRQIGFIAQDLEKISPELVSRSKVTLNPDDTNETIIKTVHYSKIQYILVNAIKELYKFIQDMFSRQQVEIDLLKKKAALIDELKVQVDQQKTLIEVQQKQIELLIQQNMIKRDSSTSLLQPTPIEFESKQAKSEKAFPIKGKLKNESTTK